MKKQNMLIGYDIKTERGPILKPIKFEYWDMKKRDKNLKPEKPLKYMADILLGLSFHKLNPKLYCPVQNSSDIASSDWIEAWNTLDPHHHMFTRARKRVDALKKELPSCFPQPEKFEKSFMDTLNDSIQEHTMNFKDFWPLLDAITFLESKLSSPLLFNFNLNFSHSFIETCQAFYSFLYHLRSVMTVDYNAHVQDASHEALKLDSIADYLPKSEYVVNDALIYWNFKKLSTPFVSGKTSQVQIEKLLVEPMKKNFNKYAHNACYLIDQLPESFLKQFHAIDLEEALYLVQMDWLLGSDAGVLFRLREELYGLLNGYEKIFWPDLEGKKSKEPAQLSLFIEVPTFQKSAA